MPINENNEPYTPMLKGYLTYEQNYNINGIFLNEVERTRYKVTIDGITLTEIIMPYNLRKEIEKIGGTVSSIKIKNTTAKKEIFGIPVIMRKLYLNNKFVAIRIRVTGNTVDELMEKITFIRENLSEYGIIPKECLWDRIISSKVT